MAGVLLLNYSEEVPSLPQTSPFPTINEKLQGNNGKLGACTKLIN